jgi:hypothetical protein
MKIIYNYLKNYLKNISYIYIYTMTETMDYDKLLEISDRFERLRCQQRNASKKWITNNQEKQKESCLKYQANRKLKDNWNDIKNTKNTKARQYYDKQKKIEVICVCGAIVNKTNHRHHKTTETHILNLLKLENTT